MNNDTTAPGPVSNILIVEDSATQARHIAHLLESNGYRVRVAANGVEGLSMAKADKPTIIVSDIAMPEMDGFTLCQEVKKDAGLREVPVILLTSLTSLYDVIKGLDCGADNFIRKPFEERYLLGRIRFILANCELRSNDVVQLGMRIKLGGQTHFITAERQQIFDLLISTYEEAIHMTEEIKTEQDRTARSYQSLEGLYKLAESLNPAHTESTVAELALEHILNLPGVTGGSIKLFDVQAGFRIAASCGFGSGAAAPTQCPACICEKKLLDGQLRAPEMIAHCALLAETAGRDGLHGSHLSIPLATGERTLGVLNLVNGLMPVHEDDFQVLNTAGKQVATALERAYLYGNMEALIKERTESLQAERHLLSAVVNTSGALVCMVDSEGRIVLFNPACEASLGWKADEVQGRHCWNIFLMPEEAEEARRLFDSVRLSNLPASTRGEWLARDGSIRHIIWTTTCLEKAGDAAPYFLGTGIDVTELHGVNEKLRYMSNFDVLTGLPNRILLRDRIKQLQEKTAAGKHVLGLLLMRFERLTLIRESLGSRAEQDLLRQAAGRLRAWVHADDSLARFDDRALAIVAVRAEAKELSVIARQALELMTPPFLYEQQELHLDAYIGISMFPNDGDDYDTIVQGAEAALRRALSSKAERYEFDRPELNHGAHERFKFEGALRRALERDELLLHYQPQLDLTSGKIIGMEALVRWQHPELGLIPPGRFIGLAEETGLILPIGEWVLRRACEQSCAWQRAGMRALPVSVNLSARQFSDKIAATVKRVLDETGLDPRLLELELTESTSMDDPQHTIAILRSLKAMGVRLAIDDFGTGYSNLNYLKRFPVDKLKLDQSFVRDIVSDPDDLSIARAVIAMAHGLRLGVIAEGVETVGQLSLLAHSGCDEMQGFLFSKPVDAAACERLVREDASLALDTMLVRPYERSLLFVDDEPNLIAALKRSMRYKGYKLFVAGCAAEAFEILAINEIGVILCDQRMPGMSGTEFLSRVKQMYPDIVRMVLSGYTDLQSVTNAVNHGAIFKFLTKPWDDEQLFQAVRDAFDEFESRRSVPAEAGVS